jgi:hypothetical protein
MKSILLYKILNDYTAPNLKESLTGSSLTQANYNLRNSYTDLAFPKPRREILKKVLNTAGQSFGIAFLGKQKRHGQSIFSNKILIFYSVTIMYESNPIAQPGILYHISMTDICDSEAIFKLSKRRKIENS